MFDLEKNKKTIMQLILFTVVIIFAFVNIEALWNFFMYIIKVFMPFIIGAIIAFVLNVLLHNNLKVHFFRNLKQFHFLLFCI